MMTSLILASFQSNLSNMLSQGLPIMIAGMMGIFVVIGIIIATVALLGKMGNDENLAKGLKALFSKQK
jgi:Na+-transporting methylmalonyl-CoA/oxaloacetate decarboxylase gamma subunit